MNIRAHQCKPIVNQQNVSATFKDENRRKTTKEKLYHQGIGGYHWNSLNKSMEINKSNGNSWKLIENQCNIGKNQMK